MPEKEPLAKAAPSKQDLLVESLRECLQSEGVRAGERLPSERDLARMLGATRGDIRRAIGYLAALGVLEVRHGVGAFLARQPGGLGTAPLELLRTSGSFETWQMFEARRALETELAALAAERRSQDHLKNIADEIAAMAESVDEPNPFLVHDIRFHRAIASAAGNPVLAALMESIAGTLYKERESAVSTASSREDALRHHRAVYQAIAQQNGNAARIAMHNHLVSAEQPGTAADEATHNGIAGSAQLM